MGVKGLWTLIEPAGKPIPLESLQNKILAIDVSIWLNQAVKGFRDVSGHAVPHAHVLGLFHRICKLLFYRIKPVFVFDGVPPALKRSTLARRRRQKAAAVKGASRNTAKILDNLLRSHTVARKLQRQSEILDKAASQGIKAVLAERTRTESKEKDLFELPALQDGDADSDSDREGVSDEVLQRLNIDHRTDIHQVDLEGDAFKALPTEQQYEVLMELRERRKQSSWAKLHEMPREATDFSGFQMQRLIKRSTIQKRMDTVGSDLSEQNLLKLDENLFVGDRAGLKRQKAERKRIAGADFVYIDYSQPSEPWEPSTSKRADDAEEKDYTAQDEEIAKALARSQEDEHTSQNQLLALAAMKEGLSDDEDSLIVMPSTSFMKSSYHGGLYPGEEPFAAETEEPLSVLKNVQVMSEESSSSSDSSIKEEVGEEKADDLFADVFENKDNVEALDSIFAGSVSEGAPKEEKEDAIEITIDVARKQARHKRHASQTSHDSSNSANKDPISTVEDAYNQFEDTVDMLSHISKRAKRDSIQSEDTIKKDITAELATTMKKSDHLMLKVFSKYAEEFQGDTQGRGLERQNSKTQKSDLEIMLESQTESLVKEMNQSSKEERLRAIKQIKYADYDEETGSKSLKTEGKESASKMAAEDEEEQRVFESHGVELQRKGDNGGITAQPETATYGSSAPGFVRSGKRDVIEVSPSSPAQEDALDATIREKLNERDASAADSLTDDELRKIQRQLSMECQQLIAERTRQERMAASVSDQMYSDCQELLQLFGIPWIVAPSEAEAQCAFLDVHGLSNGTITDDSDIWVFGGKSVFKNFFDQDRHCEQFGCEEIAKHFGLTREKMVLLAMLTGSDYTDGIESVGPVTALEILAEFAGIGLDPLKQFKAWWDQFHNEKLPPGSKSREAFRKLKLPQSFPEEAISEAYLSPLVDDSTEKFTWAVPNFVEIRDYAIDKFGWTRQKVDNILKPIIKKMELRSGQGRIDNYFHSERLKLPAKGHLHQSKRVKSAVEKVIEGKSSKPEEATQPQEEEEAPKQSTSTRRSNFAADDQKKKEEDKRLAAEIYAKRLAAQQKKKPRTKAKTKGQRPLRVVLDKHQLSESDSD